MRYYLLRVSAIAFVVLVGLAPARADVSAASIGLDRCTVVAVMMADTVDSATAHPGGFFRFQTVNAVTKGSRIIIPARTAGYGVVAVAAPAGRGGRPGSLVLEPRYLEMPGGRLGVVLDHNTSDLQSNGVSGNVPGYLGAIPLPGMGVAIGAFNYFHHGKDIAVKKGALFSIFPSDDPDVARCQDDPNT
ncbi:MAG: hypothetical protein M3M96_09905 [Candidatus Eremiobacteraeota bacterium]|nr:hypothetical protein [Candidatus Eremiobacteraeota bacterium]